MKDPAFLFYSSDFLTGVADLTMKERGQYITLLCLQHQKGRLTEKTCRLILGLSTLTDASDVMAKFCIDDAGLYYNARLESEMIKRGKGAQSSRINGKRGGRPKGVEKPENNPQVNFGLAKTKPKHNLSENEDVNEDEDEIRDDSASENPNAVETIKCIINHLNAVLGASYKDTTKATADKIKARLGEGYTLDDFIAVIDKKCAEWRCNPEMARYLRPETLFGTKFEGYLNQPLVNAGRTKGGTKGGSTQILAGWTSDELEEFNRLQQAKGGANGKS